MKGDCFASPPGHKSGTGWCYSLQHGVAAYRLADAKRNWRAVIDGDQRDPSALVCGHLLPY